MSSLLSKNNAKSLSHDITIIGLAAGGFLKIGVAGGASVTPADYRHRERL